MTTGYGCGIYTFQSIQNGRSSKVVSKKSCVPPAETVPDDDPDEDGEDDGREWDATWRTDVQLSVWCSEPDLGRLGGRDDVDELTSTTKRVATPTTFRLSAVPPSSSVVEGLRAPSRSIKPHRTTVDFSSLRRFKCFLRRTYLSHVYKTL